MGIRLVGLLGLVGLAACGGADRTREPRIDPPSPKAAPSARAPAVDSTRVVIRPSSGEVPVGSSVELTVTISGATDVASVPFQLLFNPAVLRFENGQEKRFLGGDGRATVFLVAPGPDKARVVVGHSRLGQGPGIAGSGVLCSLTFVAIGAGDAGFALERAAVIDSSGETRPTRFEVDPVVVK
jgi:general secretion pathway protein D